MARRKRNTRRQSPENYNPENSYKPNYGAKQVTSPITNGNNMPIYTTGDFNPIANDTKVLSDLIKQGKQNTPTEKVRRDLNKVLGLDKTDNTPTFDVQKVLNEMNTNHSLNANLNDLNNRNKDGFTLPEANLYDANGKYSMEEAVGGEESILGDTRFSSVPRTDGILGLFAVPPSKVSANQMYNATLDAVLGSQLQIAKAYVISQLRNYTHNNKEFLKIVKKSMHSLDWVKFLYRACDFFVAGNACGEKTFAPTGKGNFYMDKCVWTPFSNTQYMINYTGEVLGAVQPVLMAQIEGVFKGIESDKGESEFAFREYIARVLPYMFVPREDLFYVAYDSEFNPYGNSPIRRAYQYYMLKQVLLDMYMVAMSKNSAPFVVCYYDKNGLQRQEDLEFLRENLEAMTVGSTAILPQTAFEVQTLPVNQGGLDVFMQAIEYCDRMMLASLYSNGSMLLSEGGSYSSNVASQSVFEKTFALQVQQLQSAIIKDILYPLADINGFQQIIDDCDWGTFYGEETGLDDKLKVIKIYEAGVNSSLIDPSNLELANAYMRKLGLPVYDKKSDLPFIKGIHEDLNGKSTNVRDSGQPFSHNSTPHKSTDNEKNGGAKDKR